MSPRAREAGRPALTAVGRIGDHDARVATDPVIVMCISAQPAVRAYLAALVGGDLTLVMVADVESARWLLDRMAGPERHPHLDMTPQAP